MHLLAFAETIQLFPDGTLFLHIAMILAMIWVLNRTLYRPINRIIESREQNKGGHSSEAEKILKETDEKETRYNREMLDTRSKGYELIEKEDREKKLAEVKGDVAEKFEAGKTELEKQAADAHAAIGTEAERNADRIAANILKS